MFRKNKGEITSQQIVILVIVIASFAVLLYFLFGLNLGQTTDDELCHNSVLTRGSSVVADNVIPLNCRTSYVCLTKDGSCEKMTKPEIKKVQNKKDVYKILAEEMANCWWMFGEGKVNYVGDEAFSKLHCSICSEIAFDDSVYDIIEDKTIGADFYNFLAVENVSNDMTYSKYLYGTNNLLEIESNIPSGVDLSKRYFVVTGITSDVNTLGWVAGGAGLVVLGIIAAPSGVPVIGTLVIATLKGVVITGGGAAAGAGLGYIGGVIVKGLSGDDYLSPTIIEAESDKFKALECKEISTLA